MQDFFSNVLLPLGLYLVPVVFVLMVAGLLWGMFSDPRKAMKSVAGIVVLAAIFLISYAMADSTNYSSVPASENVVKIVQAGLSTFVVLLFITVAAMFGSVIRDIFK